MKHEARSSRNLNIKESIIKLIHLIGFLTFSSVFRVRNIPEQLGVDRAQRCPVRRCSQPAGAPAAAISAIPRDLRIPNILI